MATFFPRRRGIIAALSLLPLVQSRFAFAADYPTRPITILIGFAAGGVQDTSARLFAKYLQKATGQNVVVENRSGGNGAIAVTAMAQAKPDGYFMMLAPVETLAVMPQIQQVSVDPKVLTPVAMLYSFPAVLVVPASSPVTNVASLMQLAKTRRNLSFGSAAVGSAQHLMGEMLRESAGVPMTHVPYRGGSQMLVDLLAGRLDFAFATYSSIQGNLGGVKVLAVASPTRSNLTPNAPTMKEEGFNGFDLQSEIALMGPPGMPADLVQQIGTLFLNVAKDADLANDLKAQGVMIDTRNAPLLAKFIDDTRSGIRKLLSSIGILVP